MSRYLDHLGPNLDESAARLRRAFQKRMEDTPRDQLNGLRGMYEEEFSNLNRDFPRCLYSGFVTTWYSFVEFSLLNLCEMLNLRIEVSAFDKPMRAIGGPRARKFLQEALDYTVPPRYWQEVSFVRRTRNRLVHELGRVRAGRIQPEEEARYVERAIEGEVFYLPLDQNLANYLDRHQLLDFIGPYFLIRPDYEFSSHLIEFADEMFHTIQQDID